MADRFVKWEGDKFKIVETPSGWDAFKLVNNSWERVSGKLIATLDFEGLPIEDPTLEAKKSQMRSAARGFSEERKKELEQQILAAFKKAAKEQPRVP